MENILQFIVFLNVLLLLLYIRLFVGTSIVMFKEHRLLFMKPRNLAYRLGLGYVYFMAVNALIVCMGIGILLGMREGLLGHFSEFLFGFGIILFIVSLAFLLGLSQSIYGQEPLDDDIPFPMPLWVYMRAHSIVVVGLMLSITVFVWEL